MNLIRQFVDEGLGINVCDAHGVLLEGGLAGVAAAP
jgi:hypothetical protein